jgi:hypothetical protein
MSDFQRDLFPTRTPWEVITKELPRWWREIREEGDRTGAITLPDVVDVVVPQTLSDAALMVTTGPVGKAVRLGAGALAGAAYAGDAEAAGGGALKGAAKLAAKIKAAAQAAALKGKRANYTGDIMEEIRKLDPEVMRATLRKRYPEIGKPVTIFDTKKGKSYQSRGDTPESLWLAEERRKAQEAIKRGEYQPYFDVSKRSYVDPSNYPIEGNTSMSRPVKDVTHEAWLQKYDTPETRKRFEAAYAAGNETPGSRLWYGLKQLEDEFIDELGPELGRKAFRKDMDALAATTGGMDPTGNLLFGHYARYLALRGEPLPTSITEIPAPITAGKYGVKSNAERFNRMEFGGEPLSPITDPKRFNFSANFMGHTNRGTIDEQMMSLIYPKESAPTDYAAAEETLRRFLAKTGDPMSEGQSVLWVGTKGAEGGKPMIQHINEAIERTSRITGLSPREVVRRYLIRKEGPLYSIGAASALDAPYNGEDNQSF